MEMRVLSFRLEDGLQGNLRLRVGFVKVGGEGWTLGLDLVETPVVWMGGRRQLQRYFQKENIF